MQFVCLKCLQNIHFNLNDSSALETFMISQHLDNDFATFGKAEVSKGLT